MNNDEIPPYRKLTDEDYKKIEKLAGEHASERIEVGNRHGCIAGMIWAAIMILFCFLGRSCMGWR